MQYIIPFLMLALVGGVHYYLAHHIWRLVRHFFPKFPLYIPIIFFVLMTVIMLFSMIRPFGSALQSVVSAIGVCWMGIFIYLILFCLLSDFVVLIPRLLRLLSTSQIIKLRVVAGFCAVVLAISVSIYGVFHARRIYTVEYNVSVSDSPTSEMQVVLISDVHLGALGSEERLHQTVEEINLLKPDLVCIAGDFFDTDFRSVKNPEKAIETMKKIQSRYGVFACLGNHDSGKTLSSMMDFFDRAGVTLLKDEYVVIDGRLILAGRLDSSPIGGAGDLKRAELSKVLSDTDSALPLVVLDHNPASIDTYKGDADLVLSGHTHKGQIFPGSLITNAIYTIDYGYTRTTSGTQVIVTSGAGIWGPPMRVGTNCEIVNINLKL